MLTDIKDTQTKYSSSRSAQSLINCFLCQGSTLLKNLQLVMVTTVMHCNLKPPDTTSVVLHF